MPRRLQKLPTPAHPPTPQTRRPWNPGWHRRGYLPHFDSPDRPQFVTIHAFDSLPTAVLTRLEAAIAHRRLPEEAARNMRIRGVEAIRDSGLGMCPFSRPDAAEIVRAALLWGNGTRYDLKAWVVMPNHAHVLLMCRPGIRLGRVVGDWKSITSRQCAKALGLPPRLWAEDYFDRAIRDDAHLERAVQYIHENPVRARLVARADEWRFSSAFVSERQE